MNNMRCLVIGKSPVLIECLDLLDASSIEIALIASDDAKVIEWAECHKICTCDIDADICKELGELVDYLFSIINPRLLDNNTLILAKRAAINYHDGKLSKYRGSNVLPWAIYNGDQEAYCCWHLMTEDVDAGKVLVESKLNINKYSTALSTSFEASRLAVSMFANMLPSLEKGDIPHDHTPEKCGHIYKSYDRFADGGLIHAATALEEAHRIIRSLDWGSFPNPMGYPVLLTNDAALFVHYSTLEYADIERSHTFVESIDDDLGVVISKEGQTLSLNGFQGLDGKPISPSRAAEHLGLKAGEPFPRCSEKIIDFISDLQQLRRKEKWWRTQLINSRPAPLQISQNKVTNASFHKVNLKCSVDDMHSKELVITEFLNTIAAYYNTDSFTFALSNSDMYRESVKSLGLLSCFVPVDYIRDAAELSRRINLAQSQGSFFVDLVLRIRYLAKMLFTSIMVIEQEDDEDIIFDENTQIALCLLNNGMIEIVGRKTYMPYDGIVNFAESLSETLLQKAVSCPVTILEPHQNKQSAKHNERILINAFQNWVRETPYANAIIFEGTAITYKRLDIWSDNIIKDLLEHHVSKNNIVGLLMKRSPAYVASLLACLKAGFAAMPMDPSYPTQRLKHYCTIAKPSIIITDESTLTLAEQLQATDSTGSSLSEKFEQPSFEAENKQISYVLFTSGSTGYPKGVVVGEAALDNHLKSMSELLVTTSSDTILAHTTISFDISMLELLLPLISGATMVLASSIQVESPHLLRELIDVCSIAQATPSMWRILKGVGWRPHQGLKILCGGEVLTPELAKYLMHGAAQLWNVYGPTEATIWASAFHVEEVGNFIPLGKPLEGLDWHIFDEEQKPATHGELWLSGIGLAEGYIGAEKGIDSPFTYIEPIGRIYQTGDIVKLHKDGSMEWLGRKDGQIKIRGHRIETGEIQSVLESYPGIKDNRVLVRYYEGGSQPRLCAYLLADGSVIREDLDKHLAERLPRYMIPDFYLLLDKFPLTLNGKVDTKKLPDPSVANTLKREDTPQPKLEQVDEANKIYVEINPVSIAEVFSEVLQHSLRPADNFFDHGGDSATAIIAASLLSEKFGKQISPAPLFATGTAIKFAEILNADSDSDLVKSDFPSAKAEPVYSSYDNSDSKIAIVAMDCKFPKANSIEEYWELLVNGQNAVTQLDRASHPVPELWLDKDNNWAGWLKDVLAFDYERFNISRREACRIDPAQRLLLTLTDHAIESAGYSMETFPKDTGVFIGEIDTGFSKILNNASGSADPHFATGVADSILANRISHTFGLVGSSLSLDTACSSALVAIDEAIRHLRQGGISTAVVGAANVLLTPEMTRAFAASGMLSPRGRCRTFDNEADGYVRAEGGAVIILRRLNDALADGDPILGIIAGTSTNHSGGAGFITAPSGFAQENVIRRAMQDAGVSAEDIGYVEAHGTGTRLGDITELEALSRVYKSCVKQSVGIGSVKSNIGHLEPAAGLASIIKVVLSLQAGVMPPSIGIERPNEKFSFEESPLFVPTRVQQWSGPLRAGISSFGFGGTNAHLVIEAGIRSDSENNIARTIELKAHSKEALRKLATDTLAYIQSPFCPSIDELAITFAGIPNRTYHFKCKVENCRQLEDKLTLLELGVLGTDCELLNESEMTENCSYTTLSSVRRTRIPAESHKTTKAWINLPKDSSSSTYQDTIIPLYDLHDHMVREEPVLPAAAMIRFLLAMESDDYPIAVHDIVFASIINSETQLARRIDSTYIKLVDLRNGRICWSARRGMSKSHYDAIYKKQISEQECISFDLEEVYTKFQCYGLNYGELFRSISSVQVGEHCAKGIVHKAGNKEDVSSLDGQMDGALQIGLIACGLEGLYVPVSIESIVIHGSIDCEQMLVEAYDTTDKFEQNSSSSMGEFLRATIVIKNADITLIELNNVVWKKISEPGKHIQIKNDSANVVSQTEFASSILNYVRQVIAHALEVNISDVDIDRPLTEQGMDSVVAISAAQDLENKLETNQPLPITIVLDSGSVRALADQLSDNYNAVVKSSSSSLREQNQEEIRKNEDISGNNRETAKRSDDPPIPKNPISESIIMPRDKEQESNDIAIIGISGRFPCEDGLENFWTTLYKGETVICEVPDSRWPIQEYYSEQGKEGTSYLAKGGFIDNIDMFDTTLFNLSPAEARWIDPQQRLLLQGVWEALEDAGVMNQLKNVRTGVFVGASYTHYRDLTVKDVVTTAGGLGNQNAILANRVSYFFDCQGPSMTIDTLCSSSLVALHQAVQSLRNHECDQAIVAGVHADMSPQYFQMGSRLRAFSRSGKLSAFDSKADGFIPGEGVAVLILRRLDSAADYPVKAIIKGTAVNHGGRSAGLTVPSSDAQAAVISAALTDAGVDVNNIGLMEAHGTGTVLGDPIEIEGLKKAWKKWGTRRQVCGIGSVKSNIGHLEPASGLAGVVKVILAMQKGILPPTVGISRPNNHIMFEDTPFFLLDRPVPWPTERPLAGVSAFGMGGVNAHIILAPASLENPTARIGKAPEEFICKVSAATESAVRRLAGLYAKALEGLSAFEAADFCYTANVTRANLSYIVVVSATKVSELVEELTAIANEKRSIILIKEEENVLSVNISANYIIERTSEGVKFPSDVWKQISGANSRIVSIPVYPFDEIYLARPKPRERAMGQPIGDESTEQRITSNTSTHPFQSVSQEVT